MRLSLDRNTQFARRTTSFGTIRKVPASEARRWKNERAHIKSNLRRDWTHEEVDRLVTMLDEGHDYSYCARKLSRSRTAIQVKVKRIHKVMTRRPTVLTAREVARLIGKGCAKSVTRWIATGWLKATPALSNNRCIWRVCWDDLIAFLRNENYWMAWDAESIIDSDLRAEFSTIRATRPRWLAIGDVARRYCVISNTVGQWIEKGFIPAVRYGNWYIREDVIEGWVPPCERSKAGIPKAMGRTVTGKRDLIARPLL